MRRIITSAAAGCVLALGCGDSFTAGGDGGSTTSPAGATGGTGGVTQGGGGSGAEAGAGGEEERCGTGSVATLVDDFSMATLDSSKWQASHDPEVQVLSDSQHLVFDISLSAETPIWRQGEVKSVQSFRLTKCAVYMEAFVVPATMDTELWLAAEPSSGVGLVEISLSWGDLEFSQSDGSDEDSSSTSFDANEHHWWRIREQDGSVHFDTSADANQWTPQQSWPTAANLDDVYVIIGAGADADGSGNAITKVDNVNTQ